MKFKIMYMAANWKQIIHLLFRTYRFGVNNSWWSEFDSMFGLPFSQRWHLIKQYRGMRFRAFIGFVSKDVACKLFPHTAKKIYHDD